MAAAPLEPRRRTRHPLTRAGLWLGVTGAVVVLAFFALRSALSGLLPLPLPPEVAWILDRAAHVQRERPRIENQLNEWARDLGAARANLLHDALPAGSLVAGGPVWLARLHGEPGAIFADFIPSPCWVGDSTTPQAVSCSVPAELEASLFEVLVTSWIPAELAIAYDVIGAGELPVSLLESSATLPVTHGHLSAVAVLLEPPAP